MNVPVEYLSIDLGGERQSLSLILQPALEALITAVSSGAYFLLLLKSRVSVESGGM